MLAFHLTKWPPNDFFSNLMTPLPKIYKWRQISRPPNISTTTQLSVWPEDWKKKFAKFLGKVAKKVAKNKIRKIPTKKVAKNFASLLFTE